MPQMSPMNWMFLFIMFNTSIYMTFCKMNFMSKIYMSNKEVICSVKQSYQFMF